MSALRLRSDINRMTPYVGGRNAAAVTREFGIGSVVKLASNESPYPPFPEVISVIAEAATGVNRYPDTECTELRAAVAAHHGVEADSLWFGGGGAELILYTALAFGGRESSIVYPDPSFVMYRKAIQLSRARGVAVPLDERHYQDLEAMRSAISTDTSLVFLCNPNNPTGTHVAAEDVTAFIDAIPPSVAILVDEAYFDFVRATDYASAMHQATSRPNVLVLRTFSKIYGLAGLRIGYIVGPPDLVRKLRSVQIPFTVTPIAQAAATEALRHEHRVRERVDANNDSITHLLTGILHRDIEVADSETNFLYMKAPLPDTARLLLERGVIVRPFGDWIRVTAGTIDENVRFFEALDESLTSAT